MPFEVINKKKIKTTKDKAYKTIEDCEKWPMFIPECLEVKILEYKDGGFFRYLRSIVRGKKAEMKTFCKLYPEQHKMEFRQVVSPWPVKSNCGEWYITEIDQDYVEMVLVHRVEFLYGMLGRILGKLIIVPHFLYKHAEIILSAFAKKLEEK